MTISRWMGTGAVALLGLGAWSIGCSGKSPEPKPAWAPGTTYETPRGANARGLLDRRGLIHAHSVYSHDACDGKPKDENGVRNEECFEDFRRDLCASKHDFVMLTDHESDFALAEYPDALLYRADKGDKLVERGGKPVASRAGCPDGRAALILAGSESGFMPVGLEEHVGDAQTRAETYGQMTQETAEALRSKGAVILLAHTEEWTPEQLVDLPLDGFEMYNIHANLLYTEHGKKASLELIGKVLSDETDTLPHPDLVFLPIINEDPNYLDTWGTVLSRGHKRVTTMGTDCHRNSLPMLLPDGERVDSYRRLMIWFSNHLLVRPDADGTFDDRHLKEALKSGRLYGSFDVFGYPSGFDFHAKENGEVVEMGGEVTFSERPVLRVSAPSVERLDPKRTPPEISVRILRAKEGGWDEVARSTGDLAFEPVSPGAYRVEVRILPLHLREDMYEIADQLLAKDYVWVYSNPIYVR